MSETMEPSTGTMAVRDTHRFDVAALERYMAEHVAGFAGRLTVRQFMGGQSNPTYHLRSDSSEYVRSEEHTSELQSRLHLVCRLLLEKKKKKPTATSRTTERLRTSAPSHT